MAPKLSIIIPALNEQANLGQCLKMVFSQKVDFEYEVLIVDSGSMDNTRVIADDFAKNHPLRLLELRPEEFSHGGTRQYGSEQAQGDYLVYLVADAIPADSQWLAELVASAEQDKKIAGSYSCQLPKENARLTEKIRMEKENLSRTEPRIAEINSWEEYLLMTPLERVKFCKFDDVSSLRKRAVLEKIPIPDCLWAEDLIWSKACLERGYKIAYAPKSRVYHSHQLNSGYLFRRGFLDQRAVAKHFGLIYYPSFWSALRGFFSSLSQEFQALQNQEAGLTEKFYSSLQTSILHLSEVSGRYLASINKTEKAEIDLINKLPSAHLFPKNAQERVIKTSFTLGDQWRKVIMANPPAMISYELRIVEPAELRFGIGIKPEAYKLRKAPIEFIVAINQEPIFKQTLKMELENFKGFKEFTIDLEKWRGKKTHLNLITASQEMKYGWAGWAEPKIFFKDKEPLFNFKSWLAQRIEDRLNLKNFRHI